MQVPVFLSASLFACLAFVQLGSTGNVAIEQLTNQIAASDWLGPLAPVALSPFFGLAMLTGAATYGPDWLTERSGLLNAGGGFDSPTLFWIMAGLAVLSSLPRLSKVSKPIALACENLETYSSVIILLCIRMFVTEQATAEDGAALQAGLPADILVSIAVALNIIVINGVKLFFEFMIWLVPFPSIDAILEAGNKVLCAALMGLYMFSPTLATLLNLFVLAICVLVFGWVRRRSVYYRNIIAVPLLERLFPNWFAETGDQFVAFLEHRQFGLPKYTRMNVIQDGRTLTLSGRWWLKKVQVQLDDTQLQTRRGLLTDTLRVRSSNQEEVVLLRRKSILEREPTLAVA
ncbi:MAG: hypothetical protein Aurels2KO_52110 [Aureliella sp.]